ncbi:hypothetical protein [Coxiella endosymbiont of Ornithodoros amblus]|uniref:hypothetical protein n=1 Tax=Coxiella endosymbiont of Ornithodoros amblus TaxID=1656166 RepID=UPI00244DEBAE|nr:hypothetical protein [Coxiella endosymbiont of Ornithodoros amblus]
MIYDPNHLIGNRENLGVTCALIPLIHPVLLQGDVIFLYVVHSQMDGPTQRKDVIVPLT